MSMELPLIDVAGFRDARWHAELAEACADWGCFQIVNHGIEQALMEQTLTGMRQFFALPHEQKLAIERTADNAWGFFDRELTKNVRDWKEIFDFGPDSDPGAGDSASRRWPRARAQWPAGLPEFRQTMEAFFHAAENVAAALLRGISSTLGMAPEYLAAGFGRGHSSFLRLNHYPICEAPDEHLGISHHTDAGALTVLLADDQPGLQFLQRGEWRTVTPNPEALTINIGDIVQVWSNDRYLAPLHRVLANASQPRYSAPFFYNPGYDTDYAPLAGVLTQTSPARYRTINWGEFRAGRAAGDYADQGEEIQISRFRIEPA